MVTFEPTSFLDISTSIVHNIPKTMDSSENPNSMETDHLTFSSPNQSSNSTGQLIQNLFVCMDE